MPESTPPLTTDETLAAILDEMRKNNQLLQQLVDATGELSRRGRRWDIDGVPISPAAGF